jgi:hypothetical protein
MAFVMSNCPSCGFLVQSEWTTCNFCRADLAAPALAPAQAAPVPAADAPSPTASDLAAALLPPAPPPLSTHSPIADLTELQRALPGFGIPIPVPPPGADVAFPTDADGTPLLAEHRPPDVYTPSKKRRRPLIVIVAIVVIAAVAMKVTNNGGPHDYPRAWDPRVADLASFVETSRQLEFDHPVYVDFLTAEQYSDATRTDETELSDEDKASLESQEREFRALGLVHGDIDLFGATNDLVDTGTLAFYDFHSKRITVRGTDLTPDLRVTLVHELTHALQDQHWDLTAMQEGAPTSGAATASRALIEGDATRLEDMYIDQMSAADKRAYDEAQPASADEAGLGTIPDSLVALFGAPYALGDSFLRALEARGGVGEINVAFDKPPTTEEELFDPTLFLAGDAAKPLDALEAPKGAEVIDEGDFGVVTLFLVLAERIEPHWALATVDGWNGDAYVAYEQNDQVCLDIAVGTDTTADSDQLHAVFQAWSATMPTGSTSIGRGVGRVTIHACDPGADASAQTTGAGAAAMVLPATRAAVMAVFLGEGVTNDQARCGGTAVVNQFSPEQLTGDEIAKDGSLESAIIAAVGTCSMSP